MRENLNRVVDMIGGWLNVYLGSMEGKDFWFMAGPNFDSKNDLVVQSIAKSSYYSDS